VEKLWQPLDLQNDTFRGQQLVIWLGLVEAIKVAR